MNNLVNPTSRASTQPSAQRRATTPSESLGHRTESQTRELASQLQGLDDSGVEQYFSQQSNDELAAIAADIDPSITVNGGLSADERRDLFNRLATSLPVNELQRVREVLSEGLATEFDASVRTFASPIDQFRGFFRVTAAIIQSFKSQLFQSVIGWQCVWIRTSFCSAAELSAYLIDCRICIAVVLAESPRMVS